MLLPHEDQQFSMLQGEEIFFFLKRWAACLNIPAEWNTKGWEIEVKGHVEE